LFGDFYEGVQFVAKFARGFDRTGAHFDLSSEGDLDQVADYPPPEGVRKRFLAFDEPMLVRG
jgi:hypothetical protein